MRAKAVSPSNAKSARAVSGARPPTNPNQKIKALSKIKQIPRKMIRAKWISDRIRILFSSGRGCKNSGAASRTISSPKTMNRRGSALLGRPIKSLGSRINSGHIALIVSGGARTPAPNPDVFRATPRGSRRRSAISRGRRGKLLSISRGKEAAQIARKAHR